MLAVGFQDLRKRHQAQQAEASRHLQHLTVCSERLKALERKHSLSNTVRHSAASAKQTDIHHRLMGLVRHCHLLIPSLRGTSIEPEEEKLRAQLEALEAEIEGTVSAGTASSHAAAWINESSNENAGSGQGGLGSMSSGRLRARINEIWAQIGALRAKREAMMRGAANGSAPGAVEWAVVDHESLDQVAHVSGARQDCLLLKLAHTRLLQILTTQQKGLNHVSETLVSDSQALDVLLKGLEGVQLVGVKNANGLRPRESL